MSALLEVRAASHAYNSHLVLDAISFSLPQGRIGCLLGPSGCGKTTMLRCIAGFEPLTSGAIVLHGEVMSRPGLTIPPERRRTGMVFQDYALFPHLNVADNIAFGIRGLAASERKNRVAELLEVIRLDPLTQRYPHELSGGQQQRVALARALAPRPELLLLDEPFSNLDADMRDQLSVELREILKETHTTAILVTHDQHEAFNIADEIGIMAHGRIEQWDTPYGHYHEPHTRFVADFIGQGVFLPGTVVDSDTVQIELGLLQGSRSARNLVPGTAVDMLLRPDDVLHDDDSPLQAKVVHKAFRGAEFLYTLELPSGSRILSLVPSHHNHAVGTNIGIRLEVDHLVAFPHGE